MTKGIIVSIHIRTLGKITRKSLFLLKLLAHLRSSCLSYSTPLEERNFLNVSIIIFILLYKDLSLLLYILLLSATFAYFVCTFCILCSHKSATSAEFQKSKISITFSLTFISLQLEDFSI